MDIWDSSIRYIPAALIADVGLWLTVTGTLALWRGLRMPVGAVRKNLISMTGLRRFLLGLSLIAIGAGWIMQWPVMIAAGLIIGFEETIETSIASHALREEADRAV